MSSGNEQQSSRRRTVNPNEVTDSVDNKTGSSAPNEVNENVGKESDRTSGQTSGQPVIVQIKAIHVIRLVVPLTATMLMVVVYVKLVCNGSCFARAHPLFVFDEKSAETSVERSLFSLGNALILIVPIVVFTFAIVLIIYCHWEKCIWFFLILAFLKILGFLSFILFSKIVSKLNVAVDIISTVLLIWNYSVAGILCIFWRGPTILQQFYIVNVSAMVALTLMVVVPEWTAWALLIIMVIWDLIAVLCPYGPLRLLMKTANKRNKENKKFELPPGMLYTSMVWMATQDTTDSTSHPSNENKQIENRSDKQTESEKRTEEPGKEARSPRLGLGDFVFYSLLMGEATIYGDYNLILGCYVGIIFGFLLTLITLAILQIPLPALPISIVLALIIFFVMQCFAIDFLDKLSTRLIYL